MLISGLIFKMIGRQLMIKTKSLFDNVELTRHPPDPICILTDETHYCRGKTGVCVWGGGEGGVQKRREV